MHQAFDRQGIDDVLDTAGIGLGFFRTEMKGIHEELHLLRAGSDPLDKEIFGFNRIARHSLIFSRPALSAISPCQKQLNVRNAFAAVTAGPGGIDNLFDRFQPLRQDSLTDLFAGNLPAGTDDLSFRTLRLIQSSFPAMAFPPINAPVFTQFTAALYPMAAPQPMQQLMKTVKTMASPSCAPLMMPMPMFVPVVAVS
jgi:hypothetical protein